MVVPFTHALILVRGGKVRYSSISLNPEFRAVLSDNNSLTEVEEKTTEKSKFFLDFLHLFHKLRTFTYKECLTASRLNPDRIIFCREHSRYPLPIDR